MQGTETAMTGSCMHVVMVRGVDLLCSGAGVLGAEDAFSELLNHVHLIVGSQKCDRL